MSFKLFSGDQTVSTGTKVILLLSATVVALAAIAGLGAAATEEFTNETVTGENVTVEVTWNDSITDPANATADVTVYNATEFDDDPSTATAVVTDTISADPGNTTETEYTSADGLEDGTDYQLVIEADDTEVESVSVDDGTGGFLPGLTGGSGGGLIGVAALLVGGYVAKEKDLI